MYADVLSEAMDLSIKETVRRREIQESYNKEHGIVPKTIEKEIKEVISNEVQDGKKQEVKMSKKDKAKLMLRIEEEMKEAAKSLDFERAMELRNVLFEMRSE